MIAEIKALAEQQGDKLEFIPIGHVMALQKDLERFKSETRLSEKQIWALGFSSFEGIPKYTQSIIIAAIPNNPNKSLEGFRVQMIDLLKKSGYKAKSITSLPLKRMAAQSGLGFYGRNNIIYVDGMGSRLSLAALATNIPCDINAWIDALLCHRGALIAIFA